MYILKKVLYYYSAVIASVMVVGGFFISNMTWSLLIQNLLFLPLVFLLWISIFKKNMKSKTIFIVLIYSTVVSLIISVGGIFTIKEASEIIFNLIFLPVTIQFVVMLIAHSKKNKKLKKIL